MIEQGACWGELLNVAEEQVALHVTVVTSTSARSGVAMHAMDARAAWVESSVAGGQATTATPEPSSNDP